MGIAAAAGLVIFFVCAMYTHVLAHDISPQFGLAAFLLALDGAAFRADRHHPSGHPVARGLRTTTVELENNQVESRPCLAR